MKAGLAVIEALRAEGIDTTFGIVGIASNGIVTEMHGRPDIRFVDTRHEEGAAFMAYGYARASGRPTACITTSGPATTNLATGIALAHKGRAPVIVIAGDTPRHHHHRDGHQALDLVEIFRPITQLAVQVGTTERILEMLRYGLRCALTGRTGPVLVSIPSDLLEDATVEGPILPPAAYRVVDARIAGDPAAVERAAQLLAAAERPVLLAGGGVIDSQASEDAVALAEELDMAMAPSWSHHDAIPNSHPLYVGPPGFRGAPESMDAIRRADVLLALGARINQTSTFWNDSVIAPGTRIVQVELDPREIGRNYPIAAGILGDARTVARQLLAAVRAIQPRKKPRPQWRAQVEACASRRRARLEAERDITGHPIMPQRVFTELRRVLPRECMITVDAGAAPGLAYDRVHFEVPRTMFNYSGQGGLGGGYCISLGTRLGRPDRAAVSLQGDGGFMYTIQEINTAVRWKIPQVAIVMNNNCHGAEKAQQQRNYGGRLVGVDLVNPRFDRLAQVCGARGFYAERTEDIAEAVSAALAVDGPSVVEIPVAEYFPASGSARRAI
ncbi:MAG: thiamine pyrophosphate-binding protein [Burkholderiales bacterium]|nr:thiamine pyrophosphate-binding protein [Burkholderiales bacterium]